MKPILFSTSMVKAILAGNKTQTRRIMNPQPVKVGSFWHYDKHSSGTTDPTKMDCMPLDIRCKYGQVGDVLWIRETWNYDPHRMTYCYKATEPLWCDKWKPSIFMPREACRLFLKITSIEVERLQDISEQDAISEGIEFKEWKNGFMVNKGYKVYGSKATYDESPIVSYWSLWESINGPGSWDSNPFVWKITFQKIDKPNNL